LVVEVAHDRKPHDAFVGRRDGDVRGAVADRIADARRRPFPAEAVFDQVARHLGDARRVVERGEPYRVVEDHRCVLRSRIETTYGRLGYLQAWYASSARTRDSA